MSQSLLVSPDAPCLNFVDLVLESLETVKIKQVILDELQLPSGSDKLAELVGHNSASQCRA